MDNTTLTDDLIAEIERVDDMDGIHMIAHSDMKALIAELRSLRADAERYRWLIEQPWFQSAFDRYDIDDGGLQSIFERECAHVIDTAMQASKKEGGV